MSLDQFIRMADSLVGFEANFNDNKLPTSSVYEVETHREEFRSLWHKVKQSCERCLLDLEKDVDQDDRNDIAKEVEIVKDKYDSAYITYCRCVSKLSALIQDFQPKPTVSGSNTNHGFSLPPCELTVFHSDYMTWPTFRDMFTAVCINNPKLSPIEKLFHLTQKTTGEAHDIVTKSPLTNDGFKSAWTGLCTRFENKRVLVNGQLRVLFNLKTITAESSESLMQLQRDINSCIDALKLYSIDVTSWDPIFVFVCSNRLPDTTLTLWEQTLDDKTTIPRWSQLDSFLTNRYRTLESVSEMRNSKDSKDATSKSQIKSRTKGNANNVHTFQTNVDRTRCRLCSNEYHIIRKCPRFLDMDYAQKFAEIKASNLCLNCFSRTHTVKNCQSKYSCYKCNKRHNTLLHKGPEDSTGSLDRSASSGNYIPSNLSPSQTPYVPQSASFIQSTNPSNGVVQTCFSSGSRGILLGTAMVHVYHLGISYKARALLDSGSEGTFISERLFNILKLPFKRTCARISGLNDTISADVRKECTIVLGSTFNGNCVISTSALVVPQLSGNLPSRNIDIRSLSDLPAFQLADPRFYESSRIDILLGGDVLPSIMLPGFKQKICGSLMAQETAFGWILTGSLPTTSISSFSTSVSYLCEISLDKEISRFWEVENLPRKKVLAQSDMICEELYTRTTRRGTDGRYIVSLPFKDGFPDGILLGQSRSSSLAQFFRNENRLLRNLEFKREYDEVLRGYSSLNHMYPVCPPCSSKTPLHYYLPHHAVIKPESTTTKVRVVFNASSSTSNGKSLNDILHTGPVLQNDLTVLILKWRLFRFVFNGDIQKMYRQILVNPEHTPFQRILFRENPTDPVQDFELKTVTFGVNCAPYLAIRTMIQLADDVKDTYPLGSHILRSSMYVDDALAGAHTIPMAIQARNELIHALDSAGFSMRKWTANSKDILEGLLGEHLLHEDFLDLDDRSSAKTLGIRWNGCSDSFFFCTIPYPETCQYTKREVLSHISKLFDPAGWLAPIIVQAKIIMQNVWIDKTGWDDVLSPTSLHMWKSFQHNYIHINSIRIPRWVNFTPAGEVQFHGYCDASEKAYAATLYIRTHQGISVSTHLIASKTRVAPVKTLSIPRLELCGAVLLSEMIDNILPQLEINHYTLYCWTDSTIVLSWLAKPPCTWNTFVANRTSKIVEVTNPNQWSHVSSEDNPADLASRGIPPQDLVKNGLWWHGPQWLSESSEHWPDRSARIYEHTDLEKKPLKVHFSYFQDFDDVLERFSSLPKALRVVSYVYRFYYATHANFRTNYHRESTVITAAEITLSRNRLISMCQKAWYPKEYLSLSNKRVILSSSSLLSLNPFLDPEGIMRICGRLESAPPLSYDERHPILLPYDCQYSRLLIKFIHQISLHGGNQLVLRLVRTNYWIPKVQNLIKTIIHHCKPCILYKRKCQKQLMAALPPERSDISRPFTHTGLDFAGPFDIKNYTGRACLITKGYVCVFVCFSTKAIHIEATSNLSTSSFLAAFSRFVSRRGCPLHLHSDNGTTFIGASRLLAKEFILSSHQAISSNYAHQNLTWHFIPPGAPHMGGLWEAGVKSFKQHLRKTAGISKYTFEEFQTLLSKIEACLNSRPLSPISQNPSDLSALTPGHFLVGSPILVPIDPHLNEAPLSISNRWQRVKAIHQQFCIRWKNEYLKELHKRTKWKKPEEDIKENMLVVIKDENLPPNCWRLGRIIKVYPGSDNRIRVAEVFTQKGSITRPITKLVLLPSDPTTL